MPPYMKKDMWWFIIFNPGNIKNVSADESVVEFIMEDRDVHVIFEWSHKYVKKPSEGSLMATDLLKSMGPETPVFIDLGMIEDFLNVSTIADNGFADCTALASIRLYKQKVIGNNAFHGCSFKSFMAREEIGNYGLETIGAGAFSDCTSLTNVTIAGSIKSIGENAFAGCTNLNEIIIKNDENPIPGAPWGAPNATVKFYNRWIEVTSNQVNMTYEFSRYSGFGKVPIDLIIPSELNGKKVTMIGQQAFQGASLASVTILDGITSINTAAFHACDLKDISLPSTMTSIDSVAFEKCNNLTTINIHRPQNSISGAPWGAPNNPTINWLG